MLKCTEGVELCIRRPSVVETGGGVSGCGRSQVKPPTAQASISSSFMQAKLLYASLLFTALWLRICLQRYSIRSWVREAYLLRLVKFRASHVANVARIVRLVLCSCCIYTFAKVTQRASPTYSYIFTRTPTSPPHAIRACASGVARDVLCPFDAHRIFIRCAKDF